MQIELSLHHIMFDDARSARLCRIFRN